MGRFLALAVRQGRSLAVVLAEEDEELVLAALAKDATPLVPDFEIDRDLLARLPHDLPERLGLAPLVGYSEADLVAVAMMDPTDRHAALEVERILKTSIMRVRVRPLLLRKALMELGSRSRPASDGPPTEVDAPPHATQDPYASPRTAASQRPLYRAPEPSNRPHFEPPRSYEPQPAARLSPGEYRLEHPGFALLGMPVVQDSIESAAPPAIRTPPFGSRSVPVLADLTGDDDDDDFDEEPIPLVRKASSPTTSPVQPEPPYSAAPRSAEMFSSNAPRLNTSPVSSPFSVRHARTLAPPPSMSAPPPSFSGVVPPEMHRAPSFPAPAPSVQPGPPPSLRPVPLPSVRPAAPQRSITPTAIPSVGLHAFTRMSMEEYTTRLGMLRTAKHRDDVTGELLTLAHAVAEQAIVLAAKGERYTGWSGSLSLGNVRSIEISAREPTVFTRAALEDGFLGQLVPMPAHRALLEKLHGYVDGPIPLPLEVAVWPVVVAKRPVLFLLAARLTDPLVATQRFSEMCRAASQGLYRLLRGGR